MGRPHPDRQLRDARAAYLAAVRRLSEAMLAFDESGDRMRRERGTSGAQDTGKRG